jgi:DNA (cytosine-5)-methyltransferase 1
VSESKDNILVFERTKAIQPGLSCVDLFAGAGGLAEGFRQAGWSILAANDANQAAGETFRINFPEAVFFEGPISSLTSDLVLKACGNMEPGELDCLIGGPPCQSFSYNNHQRNAHDDRARLFDEYLNLVAALLPKTLVMENVPGILTIDKGSVLAEIRLKLEKLEYVCDVRILSAEEYGTPQVRRRVFIVASRVGDATGILPLPTHLAYKANKSVVQDAELILDLGDREKLKPFVTVEDAIGDLPAIDNGGGSQILHYGNASPVTAFQEYARSTSSSLYNHVCHNLTSTNLDRMKHVPEGGNWRNIPRHLLTAGMQRAKPSDHTKRYGRLSRKGIASTLLTKCDPHWGAYVHPLQDRTISVREAARLQGFPDKFRFAGESLGAQYEQVGNAVPVVVAKAVGDAVAGHLKENLANPILQAAE